MTSLGSTPSYRTCVDTLTKVEWDEVVAQFADGVFDQTWAYAATCWGADNLSHLIARDGDRVVAACQVVLLRPPLLKKGIAYVKFGPLWQPRTGPADWANLSHILKQLRDEYVTRRGLYLRIMPPTLPELNGPPASYYTDLGLAHKLVPDAVRFLVDLSQPIELLRAGLKSKWRYHLKKAEQQEMDITRCNDTDGLAEFLKLYAAMRTRKKFEDTAAVKRLAAIHASLPPELQLHIWLCRHGDRPVAGAVVSSIGDVAFYLFGATNDDGREMRAGYILQWAIVQWLKTKHCQWYDLGGGCENTGLIQFKSGLVGKNGRTPVLPGYFDLSGSPVSSLIATSVFGLRERFGGAWERLLSMKQTQGR